MSDITWRNDTRKLAELVPWSKNPKKLAPKHESGLKISIRKFGLALPILIGPGNEIYDGNQRERVLRAMEEYGPDAVIDVRVSSRPLTEDERKELVARLQQHRADWDFDLLSNLFTREEMEMWGFSEEEIYFAFTPDFKSIIADSAPGRRSRSNDALVSENERTIVCPQCGYRFKSQSE